MVICYLSAEFPFIRNAIDEHRTSALWGHRTLPRVRLD
jgi:hypothetical protein